MQKKPVYFFPGMICLIITGCFRPGHPYSYYTHPAAPDYSLDENWAALPEKRDSADSVPFNTNDKDGQQDAKADVFFIHPTLDFSRKNWNGDVGDPDLNNLVDKYPIRMQASVFNGSCKVYAPRYRQATLYSFLEKKSSSGDSALNLAYKDVLSAFDYYISHYNHKRPFIIASHSQGSRHAFRLLTDRIENDPELRKRFICAYAIGFVPENCYENIPPCDSASQTGCLISWNTYLYGSSPKFKVIGCNEYCTNPLSWNKNETEIGAAENLGGVDRNFMIYPNITGAKINNGVLWVHKPLVGKFFRLGKSYHVSDYSLFYMNIRENVKRRIDSYFKKQSVGNN
jgi:hypothetical protein